MKELAYQRATIVYGLMVLITGVSFWLTVGHGASAVHAASSAWSIVIVLAFVKARWVLLDFMELRSAPIKLRLLFEAFVVIVAAVLLLINWTVA